MESGKSRVLAACAVMVCVLAVMWMVWFRVADEPVDGAATADLAVMNSDAGVNAGTPAEGESEGAFGRMESDGSTALSAAAEQESERSERAGVRSYKGFPIPEAYVDFETLDALPRVIYKARPSYPDALLGGVRETGHAEVVLLINESGAVEDAAIVELSNEAFAEPVLQAVRQWKFAPALRERAPSAFWVRTEVEIFPGS